VKDFHDKFDILNFMAIKNNDINICKRVRNFLSYLTLSIKEKNYD